MIEELATASRILHSALERYLSACAPIQRRCVQGNWLQANYTLQELSDRVAKEHMLVNSFEAKLREARTAISLARNSFTTIVPINILPDELLTRIFHLVLNSEPCTAEDSDDESEDILFPEYPDLLSHVCSRWRRVSTSSRVLWSHIDLDPCNHLHQGLVERAKVCANRSGQLPLYIHVTSLQYQLGWTWAFDEFGQFLSSVEGRIKSLELLLGDSARAKDGSIDVYILDSCLENCEPGVLTELTITKHPKGPFFLWSSGRDPDLPHGLRLNQSYEFLENLWHHVTVLRLYGMYPYWTSKAYHGLVELRLTSSGDRDISISESQLVAILTSSPQLRIFHFDFETTDRLPENAPVTPVHLRDIQAISFYSTEHDKAGVFFRWLAPGSLPLQISITDHWAYFLSNSHIGDFFVRSRVTKLRIEGIYITFQEIVDLCGRLPYLQVLAIEDGRCQLDPIQADTLEPRLEGHDSLAMPARLERLHLLKCRCDIDGLRWIIERRLAQVLTAWDCTVVRHVDSEDPPLTEADVYSLFGSSPGVEFISRGKPNPSDDWD